MSLAPALYTVQASRVGNDLVASLYAAGGDMWVGQVSIVASTTCSAYACVGTPISPAAAIDATRSGAIDSSPYNSPLQIGAGQAFSMLWVGIGNGTNTASMTVRTVADPSL